MSDQLVELTYAKYMCHYSKRNWFSNEPNFEQLCDNDKTFWKEFVKGIRSGFKPESVTAVIKEKEDKIIS